MDNVKVFVDKQTDRRTKGQAKKSIPLIYGCRDIKFCSLIWIYTVCYLTLLSVPKQHKCISTCRKLLNLSNSLPNDKISHLSKLKAFADDKINVTKQLKLFRDGYRIESIEDNKINVTKKLQFFLGWI